MGELSQRGMERYRIMRVIFGGPCRFKELANDTDLTDLELMRGLGTLLEEGLIKKVSSAVSLTTEEILQGKKPKELSEYSLTPHGQCKLAYLEYRDSLYKTWSPVSQSLSKPYIQEINKIVIEKGYFGHPP